MAAGLDGNQLFVARDKALGQRDEWVANLTSGSRDEIAKLWARANKQPTQSPPGISTTKAMIPRSKSLATAGRFRTATPSPTP
jgi:hypothetical protein